TRPAFASSQILRVERLPRSSRSGGCGFPGSRDSVTCDGLPSVLCGFSWSKLFLKAVRKNNFSNGAGAITDRTLEKQAFLTIHEGVAKVIFAHRLRGLEWSIIGALTHEIPRLYQEISQRVRVISQAESAGEAGISRKLALE